MSSDDGGPGTGSSSVRLSRYSRGVFAEVRAWPGACSRLVGAAFLFFSVVVGVVLGDVRAWLAAGFGLLAAVFAFFRVVVLFVLIILFVRDRVFGRLAERRSAGDFPGAFALLTP